MKLDAGKGRQGDGALGQYTTNGVRSTAENEVYFFFMEKIATENRMVVF